jgi:hypothetical protein
MGLMRGKTALAVAGALTVITFGAFAGAGHQVVGYRLAASRRPLHTAMQPGVPRAGSRAEATSAAMRMLAALVLPRGTQRLPQRPVPSSLSRPGQSLAAVKSVDKYRLYRLPMTMSRAFADLRAHVPDGMVVFSTGRAFNKHGTTMEMVAVVPRKLEAGIYAAELVDSVVPGDGDTALVRADAQVVWYPARSEAEYVTPSKVSAVRIMAVPSGVTVTISSPRFIRAVADVLNSLNAAPQVPPTCPLVTAVYQVTLVGRSSQPTMVVNPRGCRVDLVTIGAVSQPSLWDPGNKVYRLVGAEVHKARPKA